MYACDPHWWQHYYDEVAAEFKGQLWTQDPSAAKQYKLNHCPGHSAQGLGRDMLHFGGNSGYQAINLAYLFGVRKIVLLGFDMQMTNGKQHYFGQHPYHSHGQGPGDFLFRTWRTNFDYLARDLKSEGVEVINATRQTALTCFYRGFIESC